ncbi:MAG: TauD/TfdA family dioxygenase [Alphaproteobacteria bacterium]|nr:TauD/TfdA family dioxygenase [Alphaproteobacteria bacterium]
MPSVTNASGPIGAEVRGVDLSGEVDDALFARLRDLLHARGVVVVRGQHLTEADQVAFAGRFGSLQKILFSEHLVPGYPELFLISNVVEGGRNVGNTDAGRFWHTDGAYLPAPHRISMLYAVEVPHRDGRPLGDTVFTGMAAAYDALPRATKARIAGLKAIHSLVHRYETKTGSPEDLVARTRKYPPAAHPLVVRHPDTGRQCLYVSEGYTTGIEGMGEAQARELIDALCAHAVRPEFHYRHRWEVGDLLIWDNRQTLHKATFDYLPAERRLMRRATVSGEAFA